VETSIRVEEENRVNKIRILPQDDTRNGWAAVLPPRQPRPSLSGHQRFDWVIVGAGVAGLMAARRLAQHKPQDTIALVDAGELGQNASGRNAGFAIDLPHLVQEGGLTKTQAREHITLSRNAIGLLRDVVTTHGIACDWNECGRYHVAVGERARHTLLAPCARELTRWEEAHEVLDRDALQARLGTRYYSHAIYTPGSVLLNPAALCRGLGDSLPDNVTLFEHSPVIAHDIHAAAPVLETENGSITAKHVILTVNVFAGQFGIYRNRQLPILLMASLSAPLSQEQRSLLGHQAQWGVTPANGAVGATLRLTADGRLLFRHGFEYCPGLRCDEARLQRARQRHQMLLARRFPQLGQVPLEHTWMGWLSISRNHAPLFGRLSPHLFAAACCNGVGIVRHTAAGAAIADLACGVDSDMLRGYQTQDQAALLPPRPLLDIGVRLRMQWETFVGRQER